MLSKDEFEAVVEQVYRFHTKRAPGLYIGVSMVDFAREELGPVRGKLNAVSETQACLSDVIQVMTGCTIGNRYLRVLPGLGRYALTLFDREDGRGVRVYAVSSKVDARQTPELYNFFHRMRSEEVQKGGIARELSGAKIVDEFQKVGRSIFGIQKVKVLQHAKPPMLPVGICNQCGETFLSRNEKHVICDFCSGSQTYFELSP